MYSRNLFILNFESVLITIGEKHEKIIHYQNGRHHYCQEKRTETHSGTACKNDRHQPRHVSIFF